MKITIPIPQEELIEEDELGIIHVDEKYMYVPTTHFFDLLERLFGLNFICSLTRGAPNNFSQKFKMVYADAEKNLLILEIHPTLVRDIFAFGVGRDATLFDENSRRWYRIDLWELLRNYRKSTSGEELVRRYEKFMEERAKRCSYIV